MLELLEPLDVRLEDLPARSGPRRGERIGAVDEHRFERARLVVAVMALHRVDHVVGLAELLQDVAAELEMGSFLLAVDRLSDVVQQAGALGNLGAGAELARHARGEPRDLLRMLQDVLAVGRPVLQPPEQLDELGVKVRDRELESGRLPFLSDLFPQLRADFFDDLFDARRVDPPVDDQLFEREPGDFAPDRLERADHDRLGSVIDDEVDAGRRFERPDVPPLAADDPSLQVVRRELDDRDGRLDDRVGGQPLDRHADLVAGLLRRLLDRLFFDAPHEARGLHAGFVLDRPDQVPLRVGRRQARDLFQPLLLLLDQPLGIGARLLNPLLGVGQGALLARELLVPLFLLGQLSVEVLFLLGDPFLQGGHFLAAELDRLVELDLGGEDLFLRLDRRFPQARLGGPGGFRQHAVRLRTDRRALAGDLPLEQEIRDHRENDRQGGGRDRNRDGCVHFGSPRPGGAEGKTRLHDFPEATLPTRVLNWDDRFLFQRDRSFHSCPRETRGCRRQPSGPQGVVQFSNQAFGPDPKVRRLAGSTLLRLVKIVRDVQSSQDGNFRRIHRRGPFRDFFHSRVDQAGQIMNVGAVTFGPDVVGLAEDLHLRDAAPLLHAMAFERAPFNG